MEKTAKLYYSGHAEIEKNCGHFHRLHTAYIVLIGKFISLNTAMRNWDRFEFLISRSYQRKNKLNPKKVEIRP